MENSIINLGELSKPATVLIEKISAAVGGIFKPYQIKRIATAEAEADLIHAESQIQITDLHRRALRRFVEEESRKQSNIESITSKSIPLLDESADPQSIEDDWLANFFDKCRIVSDAEMQRLWSHVLASEANTPGTFSRRTVNLIADLDKRDAELFQSLCRFGWRIGNIVPLIFELEQDIYAKVGINFNTLNHLENLGLIQFNGLMTFTRKNLPDRFAVGYYGMPLELTMPSGLSQIDVGHVLLTQAGGELAPICGATPIPEFFDYVREYWAKQNVVQHAL